MRMLRMRHLWEWLRKRWRELGEERTSKGQGKGVSSVPFKAESRRVVGETKKGAVRGSSRSVGRSELEGRGDKETRKGNVLSEQKTCSVMRNSKESQLNYQNVEVGSGSSLEQLGGRKVKLKEKENLNPGDRSDKGGWKEGRTSTDLFQGVEDEDLNGGLDSRMEEECAAPAGAASKGVASVLRDMRSRYKASLVIILEPRISGVQATKIIKKWGFKHSVRKEVVGFSAIYANPNENRRHELWEMLSSIGSEVNVPWLLAGDFNEIKTPLEQVGGGRVNEARCRRFNSWIQDCNLIDVEANGPFYTWKGPKWNGLERVFKRLDRCLCNIQWQERFASAEVKVVPRVCSDHHPLVVNLKVGDWGRTPRQFRYEAVWQMHDEFETVMRNSWSGEEEAHVKLADLKQSLIRWNKEMKSADKGGYSKQGRFGFMEALDSHYYITLPSRNNLHLLHNFSPLRSFNNNTQMKEVVLTVELHDERIKQKVMKTTSVISGVESVNVAMKDKKLTVTGEIDPVKIVGKLKKLCHTELVSVAEAKESEKKEEKKENIAKNHCPCSYKLHPCSLLCWTCARVS
ncbi:hypothetical protein K1719_032845 [Acacia pycnantha]|nr:hypothetical protein K1719_032845 [Acacia pycnantha]